MKHLLYAFLLLSGSIAFSQTKVEKSKKALTAESGTSSSSQSSSSSSSSGKSSGHSVSDDELSVAGVIFKFVFCGAYYGLIGDYSNEDHLGHVLTDCPYYGNESGNYSAFRMIDSTTAKKNYRFDLKDNLMFSSAHLYGNHIEAKIRPFQYFYVEADYHQLFEKNPETGGTDKLALFYFNLGYDRIRFENFNIGWTIGASYVGNEVKKGGFSVGLNTEIFFPKNFSFLGSAKWSTINGKPVNVYELESKYHIKKSFVSLGFEHLRIANPTYNFITFGGGIYLN